MMTRGAENARLGARERDQNRTQRLSERVRGKGERVKKTNSLYHCRLPVVTLILAPSHSPLCG